MQFQTCKTKTKWQCAPNTQYTRTKPKTHTQNSHKQPGLWITHGLYRVQYVCVCLLLCCVSVEEHKKKLYAHTHNFLSFLKLMDWVSVNITELCPFIHSRSINRERRWLMSWFNPSGSYRERNVQRGLPCINKHTLRLHIKLVFLTKAVQKPKQKTNHILCMYMFEDIKTNMQFKNAGSGRCI